MEVTRIDEGLWRWTASLPGSAAGDDPVGCTFVDTGDAIVVVDPAVPAAPDQRARFWRALDGDVDRAGAAPTVVLTTPRHARSAADVRARYAGARVLAPADAGPPPGVPVDHRFAAGEALPAGVEARPSGRPGEAVLWLPAHRTIVTGDVLRGGAGGLVLAPLAPDERGAVAAALRALLALPLDRALPAHGAPVTSGARAALASALGG